MNNEYFYYAVIGERHTREQPYGVVRRRPFPTGGGYDEIFSRGSSWEPTAAMREAEFGDSGFDFVEIDEAELRQHGWWPTSGSGRKNMRSRARELRQMAGAAPSGIEPEATIDYRCTCSSTTSVTSVAPPPGAREERRRAVRWADRARAGLPKVSTA